VSASVAWLLEQIAADEEAARAAIDPKRPGTHWRWFDYDTDRPLTPEDFKQDGGYTAAYLATTEEFPTTSGVGDLPAFALSRVEELEGAGPHIARWDPARVLAECAAKRKIIEAWLDNEGPLSQWDDYAYKGVEWAIKALAQPYADRPGFPEEWRT
jgi:hypothetical protein